MREHLQMVVIDLGEKDDAQVIFETLNARGTPLLPADLVKNFLFDELRKAGANLDVLYDENWKQFDHDGDFWRKRIGRGHAKRARIDVFLQHYLTIQLRDEVGVSHLYSSFRTFVRDSDRSPAEHLKQFRSYADTYRRFAEFEPDTPEGLFFKRLTHMDVGTAYPFLLELLRRDPPEETVRAALRTLESWLVRRMMCRLSTRGYNRIFMDMLGTLDGPEPGLPGRLNAYLLESDAEVRRWPDDREFKEAWITAPAYEFLARGRVRMVLKALERALRTGKSEDLPLRGKMTIEHLLPQRWQEHWPLTNSLPPEEAEERRNQLVHTIGNLTLLTRKLNPSLSNDPWEKKRPEIRKHSLLRLNADLVEYDVWDETTIEARGSQLFHLAVRLWPRPGTAK